MCIVEVAAAETHRLRRDVLRRDTATTEVVLDGDDEPTTAHLAVVVDDRIVAVSTWLHRPNPDVPGRAAVQLRAMAVDPAWQGRGVGRSLLADGVRLAWRHGAEIVWARARDTALGFYESAGFHVESAGYVDAATGLPHHDVVLRRPASERPADLAVRSSPRRPRRR